MIIIKDKNYLFAIGFGIFEKILIFALFIFPIRAIKSVIDNRLGKKLDIVFDALGITIKDQTDLITFFTFIFIGLFVAAVIVNRIKVFFVNYIKKNNHNFKKKFSYKKNLNKLNNVDPDIDIRIYAGYCSILFIFLVFYDLSIASLIVCSGFMSFFQYRRLEK